MSNEIRDKPSLPDEYNALKSILEGTASHTGEHFARALIKTLGRTQSFSVRRRPFLNNPHLS